MSLPHQSSSRICAELATEFMALFGDAAVKEASLRADRSRNAGNMIGFCRWRDVERLIAYMENGRGNSTLH